MTAQSLAAVVKALGRPSPALGVYSWLLLLLGYEGLDSERGMAWRANIALISVLTSSSSGSAAMTRRGFSGASPRG